MFNTEQMIDYSTIFTLMIIIPSFLRPFHIPSSILALSWYLISMLPCFHHLSKFFLIGQSRTRSRTEEMQILALLSPGHTGIWTNQSTVSGQVTSVLTNERAGFGSRDPTRRSVTHHLCSQRHLAATDHTTPELSLVITPLKLSVSTSVTKREVDFGDLIEKKK